MPPTRGHDLKHAALLFTFPLFLDAPHTGARLETFKRPSSTFFETDAPHTGARLETFTTVRDTTPYLMPPTRGHDLKRVVADCPSIQCADAPHTGARLETMMIAM